MPRKLSSIAPDWWDYTTLDAELVRETGLAGWHAWQMCGGWA